MAATSPDPSALIDWIIRTATSQDNGKALLDGFCDALLKNGVPLWRVNVATPTIDPNHRAVSLNWRRGVGSSTFASAHGTEGEQTYFRSPISVLVREGRDGDRWRIADGEGCEQFALLSALRSEGGTDYLLRIVGFSPGTALIGAAISFTTDRPSGFTQREVDWIEAVVPALGLAAYRLNLSRTVRDVLGAYLGPMTASRVLAGQIRRGQSEVLSAVILLVDLRSFTALTDHQDPLHVVEWLDEHLEALGTGVSEEGGEILKFTGDGFIAVFPVEDRKACPCPVCERALAAAERALALNQALNERRRSARKPELAVDLVLHFGDVIYGNVGTSRRLDFTAIGQAINEASRIEKLCDVLGRPILLSDSFAARCAETLDDLGSFALRGIDTPRRVWTIARADGAVSRNARRRREPAPARPGS